MATPLATESIVEIRTTFASREAAAACAGEVVGARLAACAQIEGPLASTYRWRGSVETAAEWRCTFKTTPGTAPACVDAVVAGHPYELPEVVLALVSAAPSYAAWVRDSVDEP